MSFGRTAIAATSFACITLLSFGWSEQRGVSLGIASAQAQTDRPQASKQQASKHVAASSHRHGRRLAHRYGPGPNPVAAGADLAAGAIGTADAFAAAATAPFGAPAQQGGYYAPGGWGDYECRPTPADNFCRPYAAKDWSKP